MVKQRSYWCKCSSHLASDFPALKNYYCRHFIPTGWQLEYITTQFKETGRVLYLTGRCAQCGRFMRDGTPIAASLTGLDLFADIYAQMLRYRPYVIQDAGQYHGLCRLRSQWYSEQDHLTDQARKEQFVALFYEEDQPDARRWVEQNR